MSKEPIYARLAHSYGTTAIHVVFAAHAPQGSGMTAVASSSAAILQRLVSAGAKGVRVEPLNANELRALADIDRLGLRLDRTRRPGSIVLIGAVVVVDQRTFISEAA